MWIRNGVVTLVFSLVVNVPSARGVVADSPPLMSRLKVQFEKGHTVSAKGGKVLLELTFFNKMDLEQKFSNAEYRFALLNKDGDQVEDALIVAAEPREIVLKGRSSTDKPGLSIQDGKLKNGEDYYLVVSIRNLMGLMKFTVGTSVLLQSELEERSGWVSITQSEVHHGQTASSFFRHREGRHPQEASHR